MSTLCFLFLIDGRYTFFLDCDRNFVHTNAGMVGIWEKILRDPWEAHAVHSLETLLSPQFQPLWVVFNFKAHASPVGK